MPRYMKCPRSSDCDSTSCTHKEIHEDLSGCSVSCNKFLEAGTECIPVEEKKEVPSHVNEVPSYIIIFKMRDTSPSYSIVNSKQEAEEKVARILNNHGLVFSVYYGYPVTVKTTRVFGVEFAMKKLPD